MKTRRPEKIILRVGKELKESVSSRILECDSPTAPWKSRWENIRFSLDIFSSSFSFSHFSFFYYYFSIFRSVSRFVLINSANSALQFSFARSPLWHRCKWLVTETRWQKRHGYETPARETFVLFTTNSGVYQQRLQQRWHVSSVTERFAN